MKDCRRATRKTVIRDYLKVLAKRGGPGFPPDEYHVLGSDIDEIWSLKITVQTGLSPTTIVCTFAKTEKELDDFIAKNPVGGVLEGMDYPRWYQPEGIRQIIDARGRIDPLAGGYKSSLAFDVIFEAGLTRESFGSASDEVLNFLGEERISELQTMFEEEWETAGIFEFCCFNLPRSSPAYAAAAHMYHFYITGDDFAAGFHWRDMEIMVHEVEENAQKAIEARKKAGEAGSRISTKSRNLRITDLLDQIETVVAANPDVSLLGLGTVAKLAVQKCVALQPKLWSQGAGQVSEYLGEISRGEAGDDLKARLNALFPNKPPRRF